MHVIKNTIYINFSFDFLGLYIQLNVYFKNYFANVLIR
jgi:hypothetical protein